MLVLIKPYDIDNTIGTLYYIYRQRRQERASLFFYTLFGRISDFYEGYGVEDKIIWKAGFKNESILTTVPP